jgi:thiosulfate/3-mercaptopyruvate sulfurtransferase
MLPAERSHPMTLPLFVEPDWLLRHRDDQSLRIVDARSTPHGAPGQNVGPSGRERYAVEHLPGAVFIDYAEDVHDLTTPYAARVAPPERFAAVMSANGIGDETTVIAYDDGDVPYAARMVWMLRYYGHDAAHVLAGGLRDWKAAGFPTTAAPTHVEPEAFTPRMQPRLRASRDEVLAVAQERSDAQLLETQRDGTYALRHLDIKGAKRLSASTLLQDARGGRPAPPQTIEQLVAGLRLDPAKRTIVSCGSGVGAAGAYLALSEHGFSDIAVYDGSWMEWSHDGLPTVPKG